MVEWFNKKIKSQYLELDLLIKNQYERKHLIDWQRDKCVIYKLLLKIDLLGYNAPNCEMCYGDFIIRCEHKFLRNIYSDSQIAESPPICTLQNYYVVYEKFIKVCIGLLALLGSHLNKDEDEFEIDLRNFSQEKYPETDLEELRSKIGSVEIKNIIKSTNSNKIPRFNLKLYAFVYDAMIDFTPSNSMHDTIATNNFFRNAHRLIKVKVQLHHCHITGKILGYAHDFCNWNVRENKSQIPMIAHNLFDFHMFCFIEGYHATA